MSDWESEEFDSRFDKLRKSFEVRRSDSVKEAAQSFDWRSDSARDEFESAREHSRSAFSQSVDMEAGEVEQLQGDLRRQTAAMEAEAATLRAADQKMSGMHNQAPKQRLLKKAGFESDE